MRTREDIEAYLERSGHPHREVADDTWLVSDLSDARDHVVVALVEGLVVFRLRVMELERVPRQRREQFFEHLLSLNAEDMVHGAYGITGGDVVLVATLRLAHLDFEEFSGTLDDFGLAVSKHLPALRELSAESA